jgi:hypothetical protein
MAAVQHLAKKGADIEARDKARAQPSPCSSCGPHPLPAGYACALNAPSLPPPGPPPRAHKPAPPNVDGSLAPLVTPQRVSQGVSTRYSVQYRHLSCPALPLPATLPQDGKTPLHLASYYGWLGIMDMLHEMGADTDAKAKEVSRRPAS